MRVAFLHPELGLGGAERFVVDAAVELQERGHRVVVFTSRLERGRTFPAAADGTLDVRVHGAAIPAHVAQRLRAPCTIARMARLALAAIRDGAAFDVFVCDLVPHVLPLLRRRSGTPVVFYCHFPDRLLAPPGGGLYALYRLPIERLEERGLAVADRILVNSRYTAARLREAFPRLAARAPDVVHPGVDPSSLPVRDVSRVPVIVAVGRFDPTKNLGLAVETLAELRARIPAQAFEPLRLVIAGSYDGRLAEQHAARAALVERARRLGLADRVELRCSPGDAELRRLLSSCLCVLYTPAHEHFGYVPIEAMAAARPVIAVGSGGPTETVVDGQTGWLRPPSPCAFAEALARAVLDPARAARMGEAGRARVEAHFSRAAFGARLAAVLGDVIAER